MALDNLQIDTGVKRVAINNDKNRVLVFNPSDALFRERYLSLAGDFEKRIKEYENAAKGLDEKEAELSQKELAKKRNDLSIEICEYMNEQIDTIFGENSAKIIFDGALVLESYIQFFDGITEYVSTVSSENIQKYSKKKRRSRR